MRWVSLWVTCAAFLASSSGWHPVTATEKIAFGGGSITGVYIQVADHVCDLMNRYGDRKYNCEGLPTRGSVENIKRVNKGSLDLGVVQSDLNWDASKGLAEWSGQPAKKLRSIFSMHPETVVLMTRRDTGIKVMADLRGKRVNVGNPGSGHRRNAEAVLRICGIDMDSEIRARGLQQHEASRALISGKIDAFLYTVGHPSPALSGPANAVETDLIAIDCSGVKEFISDNPYYVEATIPANTYKGINHDTITFAVKATVVASAAAADEMVYDMVKIVFENLDELRAAHPAFEILDAKKMLEGLSAPVHPGALKYYRERGWK